MQRKFKKILLQFVTCLIGIFIASCQSSKSAEKMNGISLVASRDSLEYAEIERLEYVNANYIAVMPFAFLRNDSDKKLYFNSERQWFGERKEGIEHAIDLLKNRNFKIMLKPQIWIRNGEFTGDLSFTTEKEWQQFENSYRDYILFNVQIAAEKEVELFCIGTELFNFVDQRPEFWSSLIREIRELYPGKLVYAENWDKVDQTEIWKKLDYIGADAYFPISPEASPNSSNISKGWRSHKMMLESLSEEYRKRVIFTEYGYRSMDFALKEPWNSSREVSGLNHGLQARALQSLYEEFWDEDWFAGGFLWKWHQGENSGGIQNDRFTPQNKPAEKIVKEYYSKFRN